MHFASITLLRLALQSLAVPPLSLFQLLYDAAVGMRAVEVSDSLFMIKSVRNIGLAFFNRSLF